MFIHKVDGAFTILIQKYLVVPRGTKCCKLFSVKRGLNSSPNDKNYRPVQIERICRRQNKCDLKIKIYFVKGRKHCWLPAFSPFPTMFSIGFL